MKFFVCSEHSGQTLAMREWISFSRPRADLPHKI